MIPKKPAPDVIRGGNRFSEKHALGLDPRDHAQAKSWSGMTIRKKSSRSNPEPEVRFILRLGRKRTSDSKGTSKFKILVWF
jgi:hypothetical protein